jgi:hypothetical protein
MIRDLLFEINSTDVIKMMKILIFETDSRVILKKIPIVWYDR